MESEAYSSLSSLLYVSTILPCRCHIALQHRYFEAVFCCLFTELFFALCFHQLSDSCELKLHAVMSELKTAQPSQSSPTLSHESSRSRTPSPSAQQNHRGRDVQRITHASPQKLAGDRSVKGIQFQAKKKEGKVSLFLFSSLLLFFCFRAFSSICFGVSLRHASFPSFPSLFLMPVSREDL